MLHTVGRTPKNCSFVIERRLRKKKLAVRFDLLREILVCPAWLSNVKNKESEKQPASAGRALAAGKKAPVCL